MSSMFHNCSSLIEINVSNFNTKNVQKMENMFKGCLSLKELNLSNFNTNRLKNASYMFRQCKSLKNLNIPNFNINNCLCVGMFKDVGDVLKSKIKNKYKNFNDDCFY